MTLYHYVEALVREQMQRIEQAKPPRRKKLEIWLPDHHETTLKRAKEILTILKEPNYKIVITEPKQIMYPYANWDTEKGHGYKPALMWEANLSITDLANEWKGELWGHGALYRNREKLLHYLNERAQQITGYDRQHTRELFGFRDGKQAYCAICKEPFSAYCSKKFHECETQRQGGYIMR